MASTTFTIQEGMEVFGSDGKQIGTVSRVFQGDVTTNAEGSAPSDGSLLTPVNPGLARQMGLGDDEVQVRDAAGNPIGEVPSATEVESPNAIIDDDVENIPANPIETGGYFMVEHGGLLGVRRRLLYIPFGAVMNVSHEDAIELNCSADECRTLYADVPDEPSDPRSLEDPI